MDVKLKYLNEDNAHRQKIASLYYTHLNNPLVSLPEKLPDTQNVYHLFPVLVKNGRRDDLQSYLANNGVGTVIHYPIPPHAQACYAQECWNTPKLSLPVTERLAAEELSLPIGPTISREEAMEVVRLVNGFKE